MKFITNQLEVGSRKTGVMCNFCLPTFVFRIQLLLFVFFNGLTSAYSQLLPAEKMHRQVEVYDSTYGINIYEKLNFVLGGDSTRNNKKGYACQGWMEDFYENGKLLHKGYYVDGQLKIYKNYYENGQVERSYRVTSITGSIMQLFYSDGKLKSEVEYHQDNPQKWSDYYPSGQLSYHEENQKNMEYLIQRKSFYENGKPESIFELTDAKQKRYTKTEYYENGNIKETGEMKFNRSVVDYQKDGNWKAYDETGKLMSEDVYINGEFNKKVNE